MTLPRTARALLAPPAAAVPSTALVRVGAAKYRPPRCSRRSMGKIKKGLGMNKSGTVTVLKPARVGRGAPIDITRITGFRALGNLRLP